MRAYSEFLPREHLRDVIECFWVSSTIKLDDIAEVRHSVVPDGCSDIIFHCKEIWQPRSPGAFRESLKELYVVGQMTESIEALTAPGDLFIGIRFRAGGAYPFLQIPMYELTDRSVELTMLHRQLAEKLASALNRAQKLPKVIANLQNQLSNLIELQPGIDPFLSFATKQILAASGNLDMRSLSHETGFSLRFLQKQFREKVGISPKLLCSIVRFRQAYLRIAESATPRLVETALDLGYFDQAHFNHDFKRFTGQTPTRFFSR